jgi:hypothetical protein
MRSLARVLLLCAPLLLGTTGCGKIREIKACRGVSSEVNRALDEIAELSHSKAANRELQLAKRYSALSKSLAPRGVGDTSLAAAVRDYASLMASTESALRAHAEAVDSGNSMRISEARRELERLVKRERAAVSRINVECKA